MTVVSVFISSSPLLEVMTGSRNPVPRASAGSCLVLQDSDTITPLTSSIGKCCWEVRWCSYNPAFNSQWFPLIFLLQCLELATWLSLPPWNLLFFGSEYYSLIIVSTHFFGLIISKSFSIEVPATTCYTTDFPDLFSYCQFLCLLFNSVDSPTFLFNSHF